jgi:hypothetical protein
VEEILDSERGQEVGLLQDPSWDPS